MPSALGALTGSLPRKLISYWDENQNIRHDKTKNSAYLQNFFPLRPGAAELQLLGQVAGLRVLQGSVCTCVCEHVSEVTKQGQWITPWLLC